LSIVKLFITFQLQSVIKNRTGIECWILEKANYRRIASSEQFIHPYSKGWLFNIKQVFSWHCTASGDGINWPVIEGCDQYTLTVSIKFLGIIFIILLLKYCSSTLEMITSF
jgi:hypothetical protein